MADLVKIRDMAFGPLGLAIGYAGNIGILQQNLLALGVGLLVFAIVYFCIRNCEAGVQTLLLSVGAIAIGTCKLLSAVLTIVFLSVGLSLMVGALIIGRKELRKSSAERL